MNTIIVLLKLVYNGKQNGHWCLTVCTLWLKTGPIEIYTKTLCVAYMHINARIPYIFF